MKEIVEALNNLPCSEPVFVAFDTSMWNRDISINLVQHADVAHQEGDSEATKLAKTFFYERWNSDKGEYEVDVDSVICKVKHHVYEQIMMFLDDHISVKKPRQTALYAYVRDIKGRSRQYSEEVHNAMFGMYKYITSSSCDTKNAIKVLEALRTKFTNKEVEYVKKNKR